MLIPVFVPILSQLIDVRSGNDLCINNFLRVAWEEMEPYLKGMKVDSSSLSLRSLLHPVPVKPEDTLRKRVEDSAWAVTHYSNKVPSSWCDLHNVHVYLYVDSGPAVRAAENLKKTLWGKELALILEEISVNGTTWKYVPKHWIDSLKMRELGYHEPGGLLVRSEYDVALRMQIFDREIAMKTRCGGVIVTGQAGIGKLCFLYYLLFRLLSEKTPVALQMTSDFLVFQDDGVSRYPLEAEPEVLPKGTWALFYSDKRVPQPCSAFLRASRLDIAWIIQATSQTADSWRVWKKYHSADNFIMNYFSVDEMTALGIVLGLNANDLRHNYEEWGPSTRTCLELTRNPAREVYHERAVKQAAIDFVKHPGIIKVEFDPTRALHILFSIRPLDDSEEGRADHVTEIATNRINQIISNAAADAGAQERDHFYQTISRRPNFRTSADQMFKKFVLSWLTSRRSVEPLQCTPAKPRQPLLQIPACGKERTFFFGSFTALKDVTLDELPLCLLPTSQVFTAIDAIIVTDKKSIISIQVVTSNRHSTEGDSFIDIKNSLPRGIRKNCRWCHVFVTDDNGRAEFLRNQTLSDLPKGILVYSAVFDVGRSEITLGLMEAFDEKKQHAHENSMDVDDE